MGYDNAGELNAYTTNVRPNVDSYAWGHDEVGNTTSEN